jgi:putative ABC transport system permease protein
VDQRRAARVAVLGYIVARDLFGDASPVGQHRSVNRTPFEVLGVLTERGQGLDVAAEDDQIYIPLRTAMHRLMNVEYYTSLLLEIDRPDRMDEAADAVTTVLRQRHHRLAGLPDDFQVQNQKSLFETQLVSSAQQRALCVRPRNRLANSRFRRGHESLLRASSRGKSRQSEPHLRLEVRIIPR